MSKRWFSIVAVAAVAAFLAACARRGPGSCPMMCPMMGAMGPCHGGMASLSPELKAFEPFIGQWDREMTLIELKGKKVSVRSKVMWRPALDGTHVLQTESWEKATGEKGQQMTLIAYDKSSGLYRFFQFDSVAPAVELSGGFEGPKLTLDSKPLVGRVLPSHETIVRKSADEMTGWMEIRSKDGNVRKTAEWTDRKVR